MIERRKYKRFSATAFLNLPVHLNPLPPYFGSPAKGKLIDLSAGGMAILMHQMIPQETYLDMVIRFPDKTELTCIIQVKRVIPRGRQFLHGMEFLNLNAALVEKVEKMSSDYIDCESRIQRNVVPVCETSCAFYNLCTKSQRREPVVDTVIVLDMAFKTLENYPVKI